MGMVRRTLVWLLELDLLELLDFVRVELDLTGALAAAKRMVVSMPSLKSTSTL